MRYLKLASAINPDNDFILLNGGYFDKNGSKNQNFVRFEDFLCTSFQSLGISRKIEFLSIKNRQFAVDNKPEFKKYSLSVEILAQYGEYDRKYNELITFLDRNKKVGFRLYYKPYEGADLRYCLCDIETSVKNEKFQPVLLTLSQNSFWLGIEKTEKTAQTVTESGNLFAFSMDVSIGDFVAKFSKDERVKIEDYYCVEFYQNITTEANIVNNSYNEVPLNFIIYGLCESPFISIYRKGEKTAFREIQIIASINEGYYLEINADILNSGIWYVNKQTGEKKDYTSLVNNNLGSPYVYIEQGEYTIKVSDANNNVCNTDVYFQEEYSE